MGMLTSRGLALIGAAHAFAGCHVIVDDEQNPEDGGVLADAGIVDACPDDVCAEGCAGELHGLCLPARIDADTPFDVTTTNDDCVGSTCTLVFASVCTVSITDHRIVVDGNVCAQHDLSTGGCSEDCGGRSGGTCELTGLAAGTWTIAVGEHERTITVPFVRESSSQDCLP
jgi:hypothetical protein